MSGDADAASPCTGLCQIDAISQLCAGCARSLAEIEEWPSATQPRRREILAGLRRREILAGLPERRIAAADGAKFIL
jgi:predicted Fe-S protein YdhL (DUF1289 family)